MKAHWQGFAVGFLALTLLEVVISSPSASSNAGGVLAGVGKLAQKILSPTVPAFATAATTTSSTGTTPAPTPAPAASTAPQTPSTVTPFYGHPFLPSPPPAGIALD